MKKFIQWIKNLFKRFQFDNELFALGVDWVASETLKTLTEGYDGDKVEGIIRNFMNILESKFKKYKPITNMINSSKAILILTVKDKRGYMQMKTENKIKFIAESVKEWYNKNM